MSVAHGARTGKMAHDGQSKTFRVKRPAADHGCFSSKPPPDPLPRPQHRPCFLRSGAAGKSSIVLFQVAQPRHVVLSNPDPRGLI